jgi:diguanylate cyclase (GGDEF)-like protein/PAS domain S-box-containing protein
MGGFLGQKSREAVASTESQPSLQLFAKLITASSEALNAGARSERGPASAQESDLRLVVDAISDGVCCFDDDARLVFSNPRFAEMYRLENEQTKPGVSLFEIREHRSARAAAAALNHDLLWENSPSASTRAVALKDGRTIEISRRPNPQGGWIEIHRDISSVEAVRKAAEDRFSQQHLLDLVPAILWVKDAKSRFRIANKAAAVKIGRQSPEELIGKDDFELHPPETAHLYFSDEQRIIRSGEAMIDKEEYVIDPSGRKTWILTTKIPLRDDAGQIVGLVGASRDITERRQADLLRDGQAEILEMIATSAPLTQVLERLIKLIEAQLSGIVGSILLLDPDGVHLRCGAAPSLNAAYSAAIEGVAIGPRAGSCGTAIYRRQPVIVKDIAEDPLWEAYRDLALPFGYRSCWSTPILSHGGGALGAFAMYSGETRVPTPAETRLIDIAVRIAGIAVERERAEDRIKFMASHDVLTELPNRSLLAARLAEAMRYAASRDKGAAVAFVDLDNFKPINDSLGHNAGDELLKTLAKRMLRHAGPRDTVIRLGGDEFLVILADLETNIEAASANIQKLKAAISEPMRIAGRDIRVTSSIGIAIYPKDGEDVDTLLTNADTAMYHAKQSGRDKYQPFTPDLNAKARERMLLQEELQTALSESQFVLFYQPQAEVKTGRVFAVEALIRWMHPTKGLIAPMQFIPLAEETGLITEIGDWVLEEACRQNREWQAQGMRPIAVSVNVSPRQFKDKDLAQRVADKLERTGLAPQYLELEVTESLIMQDLGQAVATMEKLRDLGVRLSIDDFGTGYSSLAALRRFPVHRLKIDRSFIQHVTTSESDTALASAMISLGQRLKLRVIAEGVETDEQIRFLKENNCDEMQGYYFSRPLPAKDLEPMLRSAANP